MKYKNALTDPENHDSNNYIYLVRGVAFNDLDKPAEIQAHVTDKIKDPNLFYRASMVGVLSPEAVKQRFGSQEEVYQVSTYNLFGLVLDPASDDIVHIAWNCDLGSPLEPRKLEQFVKEHEGKRRDLFTLLANTREGYNELIIRGDEETKVVGVFYSPIDVEYFDSKAKVKSEILRDVVSEFAGRELPLVEIPPTRKRVYTPEEQRRNREEYRKAKEEFLAEKDVLEYRKRNLVEEDCLSGKVQIYEGQEHVANCGFKVDLEGIAELGAIDARAGLLWVANEKLGTGLGHKVARAAFEYLKECANEHTWPLRSAIVNTIDNNIPAVKIVEKIGFVKVRCEQDGRVIYQLDFDDGEGE
jgi:RimJ/RimL family protein N-acetyltransferase